MARSSFRPKGIVRLISRNDASLVVGLVAGTVVIFQRPLRFVWDAAMDVQQRYDVDLLPALTIFATVFVFHEARKRQQAKAFALAAEAEAVQARARSAELERLMTFSQALANALDPTTLQKTLWRYLPAFAGEREFWMLTRRPDRWEAFLQEPTMTRRRTVEELEAIADRALGAAPPEAERLAGIVDGDALCFPMVAGGVTVGVLGIHDGVAIVGDERKALGAATGLIAIAVRNVQLFLETREHSLRDNLTNCFNRGHGLATLDGELRRAHRSHLPLSILMFDIDHFKTINDQLGHLRGDDLLRAQQVAESVRREMATLAMIAGSKTIAVTVSMGVATAGTAELGVTALIERADGALYRSKAAGRDRCTVAAPAGVCDPEPNGLPAIQGRQ
jgi:GGDEF domain-containing protein